VKMIYLQIYQTVPNRLLYNMHDMWNLLSGLHQQNFDLCYILLFSQAMSILSLRAQLCAATLECCGLGFRRFSLLGVLAVKAVEVYPRYRNSRYPPARVGVPLSRLQVSGWAIVFPVGYLLDHHPPYFSWRARYTRQPE
jgi:hypothetical protein